MAFTYAPGRGGQLAERILKDFGGILQGEEDQLTVRGTACPTNGYAGYNRLIATGRIGPDIQLAYCWAHARRKLIEITRNGYVGSEQRLQFTGGVKVRYEEATATIVDSLHRNSRT